MPHGDDIRVESGVFLTANEELMDRAIRHAHFIERLKTGEANAVVRFLDQEVYPDLIAQVEHRLGNLGKSTFGQGFTTTSRLISLRKAVQAILREGYSAAYKKTKASLGDVAIAEAKWQASALTSSVAPLTFEAVIPSSTLLRSIVTTRPFEGRFLREWFGSLTTAAKNGVNGAINTGLAEGETVDQMVRRIRGTRTTPGILKTSRRQAESVVRTATNHVTTQAREITYQENSSLIKGVRWVSTLDSRTSLICIDLDGTVYPIDSGPRPPAHFNCRSTTTPILKSWKELGIDLKESPPGTRASMDGQVPGDVTYKQWLRRQPVSVQNDVLGPGRARLFRDGKIPGGKFTDRRNAPITVKRLLQLEGMES